MVKVTIKWGKQLFKEVECDAEQPLEIFQAQLFSLTKVPPERQKVLVKGRMVKEQADLAKVKAGSKLMLMGTADELAPEPEKQTVFLEDLDDKQMAALVPDAPSCGLKNIANTCYMASTVQALRAVPELKSSLDSYRNAPIRDGSNPDHRVSASLGGLLGEMQSTTKPVVPMQFWRSFCEAYPTFGSQDDNGGFQQQDAEECLSQIFVTLSNQLKDTSGIKLNSLGADPDEAPKQESNVVDKLFSIEMEGELKCVESEDEPAQPLKESTRKLRCHIDSETNYINEGIERGLEEAIEKRSAALGRNAQYKRTLRMSRLPPYLCVQFVRFFWRNDTQKKAKILRQVKYPLKFDVASLCTDKLKRSLTAARHQLVKENDERRGMKSLVPDAKKKSDAMEDEEKDNKDAVKAQDTSTGFYELLAVITHKGRMANSGHYVGWVRVGDTHDWVKFDDDKVTKVTEDEVKGLAGGGDWHCSYIHIYRRVDDMTAEGRQRVIDEENAREEAKKFKKAGQKK